MTIEKTILEGCYVLKPRVFEDDRGYFFESFNKETFTKLTGKEVNFVQDNQSFSTEGVLRGIHYQIGKYAQAKLVRVLKGVILDVAVDLRKDSKTFGQHFSIELSEENKKQLFMPRGFGHGFVVLSDTAEFFYKCDNFYNKDSERGILYNDKILDINWDYPESKMIISLKDKELPPFSELSL
ncbi:dTDP-4-dehydrorhamnose 3,5-epimerase [uncultured Maribacter sp.]|uniref:dTDP-4-dehydrorhamnose 3,5-epimerase n=1 Tax=uncultured Maribacter sp. TaxID=431308 RepID=UPI00260B1E7D|nr:dTDP-4-dehydrorhamnose 3,5-epimerase [uncultured Maribacter sp.]